ncbi:MAG: hypothetical protein ACYC96_09575 [Fimbriimonadaceae bacterium]
MHLETNAEIEPIDEDDDEKGHTCTLNLWFVGPDGSESQKFMVEAIISDEMPDFRFQIAIGSDVLQFAKGIARDDLSGEWTIVFES